MSFTLTETATVFLTLQFLSSYDTLNYERVQIEAGSTATEWSPWENICPITGHDEVDVVRTGKNLLETNDVLSWIPSLTKNADGTIRVVGSRTANGAYAIGSIDLKANTAYILRKSESSDLYFQMIVDGTPVATAGINDGTYTPTADETAIIRIFARANITYDTVLYPQLELGSTATEYEPYEEQTYTADLGQTVYGGTVDLVSGELVVDRAMERFSDKRWVMNGTRLESTLDKSFTAETRQAQISSSYTFNINILGSSYENYNGCFATITSDRRILIYDNRFTSTDKISEFVAQMGNETICYPLATPQTIQLTPQEIQTLVGVNNVWSEDGDIKVVFTKSLDTDSPTFDVGGIYDVTYTAVDKCGNKAKVTRQIQVGTFRTVLYADGTFIINEPSDKIEENTRIHGTAQYVYDPLDANHDYVFDVTFNEQTYVYEADTPWADHASDVTRIEIGTKISPTDTSGWFLGMTNAQYADVSNLDTSQTKAMMAMFYGCESLTSLDLSTFDTSKVENASLMLYGCSSLKDLDVSGWNLANMEHAWWDWYSGASSYIRNVETINLSNVDTFGMTSTANMFDSMEKVTSLDLSSFDTSNVEDMSFMFSGCGTITEIDVSMLNTHKVTSMYGMFQSCLALTDINMSAYEIEPDVFVQRFVTTNVEDMQRMFSGCQSLEHLYLCAFDTSKAEEMSMMFYVCTALQRVYVNADTWTTESLLYSYDMFYQCTNIIGQNGTQFDANHIDAEYAVIDTEQTPGYLWECDR